VLWCVLVPFVYPTPDERVWVVENVNEVAKELGKEMVE
jgi:hypothetical protein